jgi:hypothetical protein
VYPAKVAFVIDDVFGQIESGRLKYWNHMPVLVSAKF